MAETGSKEFTRVLTQSTGYGIVIGLGAAFAVMMLAFTRLQKRFTRFSASNAAEFATASRSIKPGLICCGIVSSWTWSATLLQSSVATYTDGLSAAWWYGVGGTIQIVAFSALAAKIKMNANGATTFLQIAKARYGAPTHLLFTFYNLVCAHIVTGSLILGASATINALTGMDIYACNFLLPIGIAVYVIAGGLRATFIVDYTHTVIIFVIIYIFMFKAYGTSDLIGSTGKMYDLLVDAAQRSPIAGNEGGSLLTMKSNLGLLFGGATIASGTAGVFCDQGYWQRAIASRPQSTTRAYFLGGISWFAIPWAFGTVMGLSCAALTTSPNFPTYPYALSTSQLSAGLVAPAAAVTLMGTGGAAAILVVTFMAATSACSAEMIAVSSVLVYDVIGTYIKPLTGKQTVWWQHIVLAVWAVWAGAWSSILHVASIDLGWLFYVQGVLLTPAVVPIGLTICWKKMSKTSAFFGTLVGTAFGLAGWMVGCYKIYGKINITNLALIYSALSGSVPALLFSTIATVGLAYLFPSDYDWEGTRAIHMADDNAGTDAHIEHTAQGDKMVGHFDPDVVAPVASRHSHAPPVETDEKNVKGDTTAVSTAPAPESPAESDDAASDYDAVNAKALDRDELQRVFIRAGIISLVFAFIVTILIPLPMFFSHYIFSKKFFTFWIAISFIWVFLAGIFCMVLPVFESRRQLMIIGKGIMGMGKRLKRGTAVSAQ